MAGVEGPIRPNIPFDRLAQGQDYAHAHLDPAHNRPAPARAEGQRQRQLSHEEESEMLFSRGTIGEGLKERMNRIDSYDKWIKAGRNYNHHSISPTSIKPEEGITEEEKNTRLGEKRFRERMLKLLAPHIKNEQVLEEHIKDNFFDLQKWIGVILKNSKQNDGELIIDQETYDKFEKLKNLEVQSFWGEPGKFLQDLKNLRFLEYFPEDSLLHEDDEKDSAGQPITLKGVTECIVDTDGNDFKTGSKYELIDRHGDFNLGNFITWMRMRIIKESEISPMGAIRVLEGIFIKAGWSRISLYEILFNPDRTKHKEFEISGELGNLTAGWSKLKEHPGMTEEIRKEKLMTIVWKFEDDQKRWAELNTPEAKGSLEGVHKTLDNGLNDNNMVARWNGLRIVFDEPASDEADKDKHQGRVGKAHIKALEFFRNLTTITGKSREGDINENAAYRSLGHDGAAYFLRSIAESSLNSENALGMQIKQRYKEFIHNIMNKLGEKARKEADPQHHDAINNLVNRARENLARMKLNDLSVSFEKNESLIKLWQDLKGNTGKKLVSQKDIDKYGYRPEDGFVTLEELEGEMQVLMRKRLGGFLKSVLGLNVPAGGGRLGDKEVYVADGRIVNKKEKVKGSEIVTIQQVAEDFIDNYEQDMEDLETIRKYEAYLKIKRQKEALPVYVADPAADPAAVTPPDYDATVNEAAYYAAIERHEDRLKSHERLAFAMLNVVAGLDIAELNIFNTPTPKYEARGILEKALKETIRIKFNLNDIEANYAYLHTWYKLLESGHWGFLNDSGRPSKVNQLTVLSRSWMHNMTDKSLGTMNYPAAFNALIPPTYYDACPVLIRGKTISLSEFLHGVSEGYFDIKEGSISPNWESTWTEIIRRAIEIEKFVEAKQLPIDHHFMMTDSLGRVVVDLEKLEKVFGGGFDNCIWAFDKGGYNYDSIIDVDGRKMTLREHMLAPKTIESIKVMKRHWEEKANSIFVSEKNRKIYAKYASEIEQKPGAAVFISILADTLKKRTESNSLYEMIDPEGTHHIEWIVKRFLRPPGDINSPNIEKTPPLVDGSLFGELLEVWGLSKEKEELKWWLYILLAVLLAGVRGGVTREA